MNLRLPIIQDVNNLGIIRLSLIRGDAQTGPVRQREDITRKFAALGVPADEITWAEDLDISAFHVPPMKRPALRKQLDRLQPGSRVVFYRLDRLVRRVFPDFSDMISFASERKVDLISASETLDFSGVQGLMMATNMAFFAQMESQNTSDRVKNTQNHLRRVGRWRGGRIPYGYFPAKVDGKPGRYLEIDPTTLPTVREIVRRLSDGHSLGAVTAWLNDEGIATPLDRARELKGKPRLCQCGHDEHEGTCTKHHKCLHRAASAGIKVHPMDECSAPCPEYRPRVWIRESLAALVRNPALMGYTVEAGRVLYDDEGKPVRFAPGVVLPEEFDKLQSCLRSRSISPVRTQTESLLLGVAFHDCGVPLYRTTIYRVNPDGSRVYYTYYREHPGKACGEKTRSVQTSVLDSLVTSEVLAHLGGFEVLRKEEPTARRAEIQAELKSVNAQLLDLFRERLEGDQLRSNHQELNAQLEARRTALMADLDGEQAPSPALVPTGETFSQHWDSMTMLQRRLWLLDTGVRVTACRGRMPSLELPEGPMTGGDIPRSIIASAGDIHVLITLGGMASLLRRISAVS